MKREQRTYATTLEVRAGRSGDNTIAGHAAVFNSLSVDLGGFRERILPGAFKDSIERGDDVRALWQHDTKFVLGRTKNDTLSLVEDEAGLAYEATPPAATFARDAIAQIRGGYVDQSSFGFFVPPGGDRWLVEGNQNVRELLNVTLFDVSPVTFPAYEETDVDMRQVEAAGIRAPALAALVRAERGLNLQPDDREAITELAGRLAELLCGPVPNGKKNAPSIGRSLVDLRNRIAVQRQRLILGS